MVVDKVTEKMKKKKIQNSIKITNPASVSGLQLKRTLLLW